MTLKTAGEGQLSDAMTKRIAKLDHEDATRRVALALEDLKLAEKNADAEIAKAIEAVADKDTDDATMKVISALTMKGALVAVTQHVRDALMDVWDDER